MAELPAAPPGVRLVTLDNGLTVILREDHSAPVVSAQAWCRAGSVDEGVWLGAGLSHVLEHMLFKGTTTRAAGRIDQEIQAAGGYLNAYTSFDRTVYWINVPNTGTAVAIDVLCDIMQHATLPGEELAKEMDVIRREMDMCHDDPGRRASRRLFETAYTRSPYRFAVIGYPDIFNRIEREDLAAYYQEKYAPNNVFLVVVGDFAATEVIAQIQTAFNQTKARPLPAVVLPEEPCQMAARELLEEAPIGLAHLHLAWHIPDLRHPDMPSLDVLALLLGGGRSSRLYQEVREKQGLVTSVDAWTYSPGQSGLIGVSAVFEGPKLAPVRAALLAEIERMKQEPVTGQELEKAVKQFVAGTLGTRKTMQGQAQDLGSSWLAAGDLNFSARYLAAVERVTAADLQRVARTYLTAPNRTLYGLLPTGSAPSAASEVEVVAEQPIQKFEMANGLRLLVKEDHRLPFVEFRLALRGGVLAETADNNGLTHLLSRMMLQGTTRRSAEQIADQIESVGGHLDAYGGNNSFGLTAEVLQSDLEFGLELVADVLLHPSFPEAALERERQNQLASIRAQRDQILQVGAQAMRRALFGPTAYGLDILGSEISVLGLKRSELCAFHQALTRPDRAVLAIYGDVQTSALKDSVERQFQSWTVPPTSSGTPAAISSPTLPCRVTEHVDKKQAVLLIGFPGASLHEADRFALELLQEACSDLGSRLFMCIRERLGLAYYVGAQNFAGLATGYFALYAGTAPEQLQLVETELRREIDSLQQEGLSEEELARAKAKFIGQKKIARQDLGSLAQTTALDELYGLGYANIDHEDAQFAAVTVDQVKATAQRYLGADRAVVAIVSGGTD